MSVEPQQLYRLAGRQIQKARAGRGLNQAQLAARIGIGRTALTNIETGKQRILLHLLYRIAEELELHPSKLLPPPEEADSSAEAFLATAPKSRREWAQSVKRVIDEQINEPGDRKESA